MNSNGYGYVEDDDLEVFEEFDDDAITELLAEDDDMTERRRRNRRPPPRTGRGGGYSQPRPSNHYVTQVQLQAALSRVGKDVKDNADAIKTVNTRVNAVGEQMTRQGEALKKEASERKRAVATLSKENSKLKMETASLKSKLQLITLLPLITKPKSITLSAPVGNLPANTKLLVEESDSFSSLLPILLLGGLGGSGNEGNAQDDSGLLLAAAMANGGL